MLILGDTDSAIAEFRRASSGGEAAALSDLSGALLTDAETLDDCELAIEAAVAAQRAIAVSPGLAPAHFNLGLALDRLGLVTEARAAFVKAGALEPDSAWADEAISRASAGRVTAAAADWAPVDRALRTSGDHLALAELIVRNADLARRYADAVYLRHWANATLSRDHATARAELDVTRKIGDAFQQAFNDSFVADLVEAADAAEKRGEAPALARAHLLYIEGRMARAARDDARAAGLLGRAAEDLRRNGSPLQYAARYYMAGALYELSRIDEALATLDALESESLKTKGYLSLAAQLGWERGICLVVRGSFAEALHAYDRSREICSGIGAHDLATTFDGLAGEALEYLGDSREAWRRRARVLRFASTSGSDGIKAVALTTAANLQIVARHYAGARLLLDYAVSIATRIGDAVVAADAYAQRSVARDELGDHDGAARDRIAAAHWAAQITSPRSRERMDQEIRIAEGVAKRAGTPSAAVAHFSGAIEFLRSSGQMALLPRLYLEKARAYARMRDTGRQRDALRDGLLVVEDWKDAVADVEQRAGVSFWSDAIREDLIGLELAAGDVSSAFSYADNRVGAEDAVEVDRAGRAPARRNLPLEEIRRALARHAAIIEFVSLRDRMVVFIIRGDTARAVTLPASLQRILAATDAMRDASDDELPTVAATVHDLLFIPIARHLEGTTTLAVIPGPDLVGIPFGALRDRVNDRYLIETTAVVHATTADAAIVLSRRSLGRRGGSFLSIGASDFDRRRHPDLEPLTSVEREATEIAALTPGSRLLCGAAATADAVSSALSSATIAHYAGHIVGRGAEARLLLSGAAVSNELSARQIAQLPLDRLGVVVLAGCRGSSPAPRLVLGDMSAGFLAAGVTTVIASTVDVDDAESPRVMRYLHTLIRDSGDPADSVRQTVLFERRSGQRVPLSIRLTVLGGSRGLVR